MNESTLLSIKQFSAFSGLNVSTLRYYDEMGILPPASRGEDNNYRYYTPQQIILTNFIQVLVELGIPLSVIKELANERSPEHLIELLGRQEDMLDYLSNKLRVAHSIIHTYRKNILNGMMIEDSMTSEDGIIRIEELPDTNFVLGAEDTFSEDDKTFYAPFIRFINSADEYKINLKYPVGGYHNNMDNCLNATGRPDRFISQDPFGDHIRPAGKYLVGYTRGYYGQFGDLAQRMAQYAEERNLYFHGPVYSVYLLDEISVAEPDEYLSTLSVRVSNRKTEPHRKKNTKKDDLSAKMLLDQLRRNSNLS